MAPCNPSRYNPVLWLQVMTVAVLGTFPAAAQPPPCNALFYDGFESHLFDGLFWGLSGTNGQTPKLRTDVQAVYSGQFAAFLESALIVSRVELTLKIDLAAYESVELSFWARSVGTRIAPTETSFTEGHNADGIAISTDNYTWYVIGDFSGVSITHTQVVIDLDEAAAQHGLAYTDPFYIRFFHYRSVGSQYDNIVLDEMYLTGYEKSTHNYGHAPDPPYPTLFRSDGARHAVGGPIMLGARADADFDGAYCTGQGIVDRDGVTLPDAFNAGETGTITVAVPADCTLDAWFDFDGDGLWSHPSEKVFDSLALTAGLHALSVSVPEDAVVSDQLYARFRVSELGGLGPIGTADSGEVEDYSFVVRPDPPSMTPLPAHSAGFQNTLEWTSVNLATHYAAEHALTDDFAEVVDASGWITGNSFSFSNLADGQTHFFRARAGAEMPAPMVVWRQSRMRPFMLCTRQNTQVSDAEGVQLARPSATREYNFNRMDLALLFSNACRMNMFLVEEAFVLLEFAMFLDVQDQSHLDFVIYEGGTQPSDPFNRILLIPRDAPPVRGFHSSGAIALLLEKDRHYCIGVAGEQHYTTYMQDITDFQYTTVVARAFESVYPPSDPWTGSHTSGWTHFMRLTTAPDLDHAPTGTLVSPVIPPDAGDSWQELRYTADIPLGTSVTVDILPEHSDTPLSGFSDVASGADLGALPLVPVRLRATLDTSDPAVTPSLLAWQIHRRSGPDYLLSGDWSAPVHSTQNNMPPSVETTQLLDPSPTRADTLRFEIVFNQAVTIDAAALNDSIRVMPPHPESTAHVTGLSGSGTTYMVSTVPGGHSGPLRLRVDPTADIVNLLGTSVQEGHTSAVAYVLDFTPPAVQSITLLDSAVPAAWPAGFRVLFSEPVVQVSANDFVISGVADATIESVHGVGTLFDVYIEAGADEGWARLEVTDGGALTDLVGWPLAAPYLSGPAYYIEHLKFTATPPDELSVRLGRPATLEVAATGGTGPLSFQWYWSADNATFVPLDGAHDNRLYLASVSLDDQGYYYCEVADAYHVMVSPVVRLLVDEVHLGAASLLRFGIAFMMLCILGVRLLRYGKNSST